jgi:hypothetical protein
MPVTAIRTVVHAAPVVPASTGSSTLFWGGRPASFSALLQPGMLSDASRSPKAYPAFVTGRTLP